MLNVILKWLLVSAFSLFSIAAWADNTKPIGITIWVKGIARAIGPQSPSPRILKRKSPIYPGDTIFTGKSSAVQIAFLDNSIYAIRASSQFKISHYQYNRDNPSRDSKSFFELIKGGFRTITGHIPKVEQDNYKVNTPVATIGVRGTDYAIYYDDKIKLAIDLEAGAIVASNNAGNFDFNKESKTMYGGIKNTTSAAEYYSSKQPIFNSQPNLTPVSKEDIESISTLAESSEKDSDSGNVSTAEESNSGSRGGTKTVDSFCIN